MSENTISLQNVTRNFGKLSAVKDLSFDIPKGCICGLVGPNGAGKTTAIRMLLNLLAPSAGKIRVFGLDPRKDALSIKQRTGYVPERHFIYDWMKVGKVLEMTSQIYKNWDYKESDYLVDALKLPLKIKVKNLSRGELAKLAMVIALAHQPDLLVLDEPTSGLDPLVRDDLLNVVAEVTKGGERTVFFSTHILSDVERIAERVIVLDKGIKKVDDSLEKLKSEYSKVSFLFRNPPGDAVQLPQALRLQKGIREWVALLPNFDTEKLDAICSELGAENWVEQPVPFEEVFAELFATNKK
jgi:ABC-type multidrug transport system ATPase subunit